MTKPHIYKYSINIVAMSNITKKQATLAVISVVFATAMIVSVIASSSDSAFAKSGKKISVKNQQNQNSNCKTAGGSSPITDSCSNSSTSTTTNFGGAA